MSPSIQTPNSFEVIQTILSGGVSLDSVRNELASRRAIEHYENSTKSFRDFVKSAWLVIEPATPFRETWSIDYVAENLEMVTAGEYKRLIINIPPRHMKSILCTVLWPCWEWTQRPELRYLFLSYSSSLSIKHSLDRRSVITSDWYQRGWGDKVALARDQNMKSGFQNTRRGVMVATSFGGTVTGKGGDRMVLDDPMNPEEAASDVTREWALRFYDQTLSSRLDQPDQGAIVIVMQRLHEEDIAGHLAERGFKTIKLPSEAEERTVISFPVTGREVVREAGSLLWPERFPRSEIEGFKVALGPYGFSAQHQQEPAPNEGGMLKEAWWDFYEPMDKKVIAKAAKRIIQFADTAYKKGSQNDYSVIATWADLTERLGDYPPGYYLLDLYRKRVSFDELEPDAIAQRAKWRPRRIVIEHAASGISLFQSLQAKKLPVESFKIDRDKEARVSAVSGYIKAGYCHLPVSAADKQMVMSAKRPEDINRLPEELQNVAWFLYEHRMFPASKHDDTVDTTSMMLAWFEMRDVEDTRGAGVVAIGSAKDGRFVGRIR